MDSYCYLATICGSDQSVHCYPTDNEGGTYPTSNFFDTCILLRLAVLFGVPVASACHQLVADDRRSTWRFPGRLARIISRWTWGRYRTSEGRCDRRGGSHYACSKTSGCGSCEVAVAALGRDSTTSPVRTESRHIALSFARQIRLIAFSVAI